MGIDLFVDVGEDLNVPGDLKVLVVGHEYSTGQKECQGSQGCEFFKRHARFHLNNNTINAAAPPQVYVAKFEPGVHPGSELHHRAEGGWTVLA
jgi:hypothetical protein